MGQHVDGDDYTYPIDGLILRPGYGTTSGGYVTDGPWPPTGPERAEQRIAALERELAETRVHVQILIARVKGLECALDERSEP